MKKEFTVTPATAHEFKAGDRIVIEWPPDGTIDWYGIRAPVYTHLPNAVQRFGMAQGQRVRSWLLWLPAAAVVAVACLDWVKN